MAWYSWKPYVPVAERRRQAMKKMGALRKKGVNIQPIEIEGRKIAKTFWGEAWCDHLESFSDYENRLPRGRTYLRNGSVCHLAIRKGKIEAKVSGSQIYDLHVKVKTLPGKKWHSVKQRCAGQIASLLELLAGNLSDHVMTVVTDRENGLFPLPGEISFNCNCPDWASMCKHVAAVLYGVGARLDEKPDLLFQLRGVTHKELIDTDAGAAVSKVTKRRGQSKRLAAGELSDVFGIALDADHPQEPPRTTSKKKSRKTRSAGKRKTKQEDRKKAGKRTVVKKATRTAAEKRVAKQQGRKKAGKVGKKKTVKKSKRLSGTGEQSVLGFVQRKGGATTAQINAHWSRQGRGGTANNILSKLVRERQIKCQKIKGARGSQYTVA